MNVSQFRCTKLDQKLFLNDSSAGTKEDLQPWIVVKISDYLNNYFNNTWTATLKYQGLNNHFCGFI